ncbi:MAG: TIGR02530 family flagellar biosynthesis protein [Clostridiaceae bacterium]
MGYRVMNGKIYPIGDFGDYSQNSSLNNTNSVNTNFKDTLTKELGKNDQFVISNHAAKRLNSRNISFNENDMKNINEGINLAKEKGSQDCVILYKDIALVTSIENRTVVTAVDKSVGDKNIFTNIDSVVLI